jgi:outer membrane protein W
MKLTLSVAALGASLSAAGFARAQPPEVMPSTSLEYPPTTERLTGGRRLAAPQNALELSVGTGYTQGFGSLSSGVGMPSVVSPGISADVGVGYRIDPKWAVLWSGSYQDLNAERTATAHGFTTSLALQYHLAPMNRLDPWVELGAGYRILVEDPKTGPSLVTHGVQLARVRVGLDFRAGEAVALGPVIGADATLFLFQDFPSVQTNIADPRVSTFVFAGLQGRFDIGGSTRSSAVASVAKR